jgi:hypothetical protein
LGRRCVGGTSKYGEQASKYRWHKQSTERIWSSVVRVVTRWRSCASVAVAGTVGAAVVVAVVVDAGVALVPASQPGRAGGAVQSP